MPCNPTITFIIPAYNVGGTLARAVRSVLAQSNETAEIVIVNDGSSDDTSIVAHQLCSHDSNINVIDVPNGGVARARNIALSRANGNWVVFLDADDEIEPGSYEEILELASHHEYDILFGMKEYVDSESGSSFVHLELSTPGEPLRTVSRDDVLKSLLSLDDDSLSGSCTRALYRLQWLKENNISFPEGITMGEDYCFLAKALLCNPKVAACGLLFYKVNQSGGSTTRGYIPRMLESMRMNGDVLEEVCRSVPGVSAMLGQNLVNNIWLCLDNEAKRSYRHAYEYCRPVMHDKDKRLLIKGVRASDSGSSRRFAILRLGLISPAIPAAIVRLKRRRDGYR